ncbi:MAG: hypothetical protein KJ063_23920 [Anaerolineae bacterium]|nr:hypothetical protein [Anaerolineae bacterium]
MAQHYNNQALREFIAEGFDQDELRLFVSDYFPEFYQDYWISSVKKVVLIQELIDYCKHRDLIQQLVVKAQLERPQIYSKYKRKLIEEVKVYTLMRPEEHGLISIEIDGNWHDLTLQQREAFLSSFSKVLEDFLKTPEGTIKIIHATPGSINLLVVIPNEAVKRLHKLKTGLLEEIGVLSIKDLREADPGATFPRMINVQLPTPKAVSPMADSMLDKVAPVAGKLLIGLLLSLLIGHLSYQLAQTHLDQLSDWVSLPVLLMACALIPLLAAAMTTLGQTELAKKYGYARRDWLPFLWHKYFSASVWAMIAWLVLWLVWLGIYGSGVAEVMSAMGRQVVWAMGLLGVALAAHAGARQTIRQYKLLRRVGFTLFQGKILDIVVLLFLLLAAPFLPLVLAWSIWRLWSLLGGR